MSGTMTNYWKVKTEVLREKPAAVAICPLPTTLDLHGKWFWDFMVRRWYPTA